MLIATGSWQLSLPGCASLKEKRSVVRSLKDRLRKSFNVSVAETAYQDVWTRAELTIALIAPDRSFADSCLSKVDHFIARESRAVIVGTTSEIR